MSAADMAWAEVTVRLPAASPRADAGVAVDALGTLLFGLGAAGLEEADGRIVAYFPDDAALASKVRAARRLAVRLLGAGASVDMRPVPATDWAETWKREVRATEVAPGLVVAPTWEGYAPRAGEILIRLDPGMAFGTGTHPSTRLCLAVVAARRPEGDVLDLGTGSGILAIAAAKAGARSVLAVDLDPVATGVAGANVARNGVEGTVRVATGDLGAAPGTFDAVLANILAEPLAAMATELARRVRPGGLAVLSGLLADEAPAVSSAYQAAGLVEVGKPRDAEWAAIVLERPPAPGAAR